MSKFGVIGNRRGQQLNSRLECPAFVFDDEGRPCTVARLARVAAFGGIVSTALLFL